jgi:hypothetical protein
MVTGELTGGYQVAAGLQDSGGNVGKKVPGGLQEAGGAQEGGRMVTGGWLE